VAWVVHQSALRRHEDCERYLRVCGRVLGLSLAVGSATGVLLPPALWAELQCDDSDDDGDDSDGEGGGGDDGGGNEGRERGEEGPLPLRLPAAVRRLGFDWRGYCLHDEQLRNGYEAILAMKTTAADEDDPIAALDLYFTIDDEVEEEEPAGEDDERSEKQQKGAEEAATVVPGPTDAIEKTATTTTANEKKKGEARRRFEGVELVTGGKELRVTSANVNVFVALAARRRLLGSCVDSGRGAGSASLSAPLATTAVPMPPTTTMPLRALRRGLHEVVPAHLLRKLSALELCRAVSGQLRVNVGAWKSARVTGYGRGFTPSHPTVVMFWDAVSNDLSEVERRKLLLFWSGSSVAPTLFGGKASRSEGEEAVALDEEERFTLSRLRKRRFEGGGAEQRQLCDRWLPEASTCDRTLRLPEYSAKEHLLKSLRTALEHGGVGYDRM